MGVVLNTPSIPQLELTGKIYCDDRIPKDKCSGELFTSWFYVFRPQQLNILFLILRNVKNQCRWAALFTNTA